MTAVVALIRNDLRIFFKDRRAVLMSFAAPILMGGFFGYLFQPVAADDAPGQTKVLMVDQDASPISRDIAAKLQGEKAVALQNVTEEEARASVRRGDAPVAVIVPKGFGKDATQAFFRGGVNKPKLGILTDPSNAMEAQMIRGMLTGHVMQAVSKEAIGGESGRAVAQEGLQALEGNRSLPEDQRQALSNILKGASAFRGGTGQQTGGGFTIPFETAEETLTSRPGVVYNSYAHSFAGFAVQFILFVGIDVGVGLLLTKERGLWKRYRAAPLSKAQLLGSRTLSATLISLLIVCGVFAAARLVFGVRIEGSAGGFLLIGVTLGFMTATYGLLIAALGKTPEASRGLSILATLVMVMLSGAWVPSFVFPAWIQGVTKVVPARWAVDGLDAMVWRGLGFQDALLPAVALVGFGLLFGAIALARFDWEGA